MKQLLFLLLFPCLAMAQYQGNGNQKITLGEQSSADGLVYRGVASIDTVSATSKITRANKQDTSAYLLLDTVTNLLWHYKIGSNAWTQAGGGVSVTSFSAGTTGLTPSTATTGAVTLGGTLAVANGGTGTGTLTLNKFMVGNGTSGVLTPTDLHYNISDGKIGFGVAPEGNNDFQISNNAGNDILFFVIKNKQSLPTSSATCRFDFGIFSDASNYLADNTVIGQTNYIGQANDASYVAGKVDVIVTNAGNVARAAGHSGIMRFYTKPTNADGVSERMRINEVGNVGIGQTTPTAVLHLKAGTATASTAPLKFTSGTNLTTAEAGAMEFNGTNLFFSPSTTRHTVNHGLTGSATLNFPSITTLLSADLTITVTGAADGDVVSLGVPNAAVNANTSYSAWVSAANTVTVRFNNYSSGTVDPASGIFKVFVTK